MFQASFNVYYDGFPSIIAAATWTVVMLAIVVWAYPITRRRYAEIKRELARR